MPYLIADDLPRDSGGKRFRALLERPEILQLPGAHTGMAALQAKAAGFPAMAGNVPFLMKDVVLLAVSLYLLKQDLARIAQR